MKLFIPPEYVGDRAHYMTDDGQAVVSVQDVAPLLEMNKDMRNENDGYSADRSFRRVASIPHAILEQWRQEGWDPLRPDLYGEKLAAKLNSSEYAHLRTADGRLGVVNGVMK